jgi:peroxiredoxin
VHTAYSAFYAADSIELKALFVALTLGLAAAAFDPLRYWPMVLSGLLVRVLTPVGYALAARSRPVSLTLADAMWWAPLSFILVSAYLGRATNLRGRIPEVVAFALRARTDRGSTVEILSRSAPVLLVFLRHAGCTFCREALTDLAEKRQNIEATGVTIVLAHMGKPEFGRDFFQKYGLDDLHQISDPGCGLYRAFGLRKGNAWMLLGPKVWMRGLGALRRHGVGRPVGDGFQMPGLFLVFQGQILRSYRHQSAADRPDYVRFVNEDAFTGMIT